MSWHDSLQEATFRGVPFQYEDHNLQGGRRVASHEFPLLDTPYTEDMGRKQRKYTLNALVVGKDYDIERDELLEALEEAGAGLLIHPYLGRLMVVVESYTLNESTRKGGMASFAIQFVESGELPPGGLTNTRTRIVIKTGELDLALIEELLKILKTVQQVMQVIDAVMDKIAEVEAMVGEAAGTLVKLANAPRDLLQRIVNSAANFVAIGKSTLAGLKAALKLKPTWPLAKTKTKHQIQQNEYALELAVKVAMLSAAAKQVAQADAFTNQDDAQAFMEEFNAQCAEVLESRQPALQELDVDGSPMPVQEQPLPDALYVALLDMQAAVLEDLSTRSLQLPRLTKLRLNQSTPSLVLAYHHYQNLNAEGELVTRNRVRHPAFIEGTVEVITQ